MERILLEERLKTLSQESGWPLESVRSAWDSLEQLPNDQRVFLTGERAAAVWDRSSAESLRFLLAGVRAGVFEQRWCVFSPHSGWVLDQTDGLEKFSGEKILDPFCGELVEPDLDKNVFVTFSPLLSFFDDKPQPYEGTWEQYRLFTRAFPQEADTQLVLADFKAFNPWELGKLELYGNNGDVFELISLEGRSSMTVSFISQEKRKPESFIERMVQYKANKASSSAQFFDLVLEPQGFSTKVIELQPGKGVFWIDNRCGRKAGVMAWKQPVPKRLPQVASYLKGRFLVNFPDYRKMILASGLSDQFNLKMSGQSFVFLRVAADPGWGQAKDDFQVFSLVRQVQDLVNAASGDFGGFLFKRVEETFYVTMPDPVSAVRLVNRISEHLKSLGQGRLVLFFSVVQGGVLLVQNQQRLDFYGAAVKNGLEMADQASPGELWMDSACYQTSGVETALGEGGWTMPVTGQNNPSFHVFLGQWTLRGKPPAPAVGDQDAPFESF